MRKAAVVFKTAKNVYLGSTHYFSDLNRSWLWNEIGTASFKLPRSLPNIASLTKLGNLVFIFEDGIIPWVGYINQREWNAGGVDISMRSAEGLMQNYITDQGLRLGAETGGRPSHEIARTLIASALGNGWSPLTVGGLWGDTKHYKEYDYSSLYDALSELCEEDKSHFWVDSELRINMLPNPGVFIENRVYVQDVDLVDVTITDNLDEVLTHGLALGEGSDLVTQPKKLLQIYNDNYYKAEVLDYGDVVDHLGLVEPLTKDLQARNAPRVVLDAGLVDRGDNYKSIRLGNILRVGVWQESYKIYSAKVKGIELSDSNPMRVILEIDSAVITTPQEWRIS